MDALIDFYVRFLSWWKNLRAPKTKASPENAKAASGFLAFYLVVIAALALPVVLGMFFLSLPPEKGQEAGQYEYVEAHSKSDEVSCTKGSNDHCSSNQDAESSQEEQHAVNQFRKDKRDINAQEGMWRAANALVVLTIIQVLVGACTVYFLIVTFRTQRSELGQAKRSANAAEVASEPHVFIQLNAEILDSGEGYRVVPRIVNYGQTPATEVHYSVYPVLEEKKELVEFPPDDSRERPSAKGYIYALGLSDDSVKVEMTEELGNLTLRGEHQHFSIRWSYENVSGQRKGPFNIVQRSKFIHKGTYKDFDPENPDFTSLKAVIFETVRGKRVIVSKTSSEGKNKS